MENTTPPFTAIVVLNPVSSIPLAWRRARPFAVVPLYVVKKPQTRIFPSGWSARFQTVLFAPTVVTKPVSSVPLVLSLAMRFAVIQLYPVKPPQISVFPSGWRTIVMTELFTPDPAGLKVVSSVASE